MPAAKGWAGKTEVGLRTFLGWGWREKENEICQARRRRSRGERPCLGTVQDRETQPPHEELGSMAAKTEYRI